MDAPLNVVDNALDDVHSSKVVPEAHSRPDIAPVLSDSSAARKLSGSSPPPSPSGIPLPESRNSSLVSLPAAVPTLHLTPPDLDDDMRRLPRSTSHARGDSTDVNIPSPVEIDVDYLAPDRPSRPQRPGRAPTRGDSMDSTTSATDRAPAPPGGRRSIWGHLRSFLGHGNPRRQRVVHLVFSLTLYLSQIVVCIVFITLTQTSWTSKQAKTLGRSEWDACDKPLGSMMIVWLVRCILGVLLALWAYRRSVNHEIRAAQTRAARRQERREQRRRERQARIDLRAVAAAAAASNQGSVQPPIVPPAPIDPSADATPNSPPTTPPSPSDVAYDRSLTITSILIIAHFLITNILVLSSTHSCRVSSPHLWWSTFAMLCLTYVIILEVFLIGFAIFIVMPMLFIGLNILLILTGHRPISARQMMDPDRINPETPKMPQKLVDKIPLVMYIPAPGEGPRPTEDEDEATTGKNDDAKDATGGEAEKTAPSEAKDAEAASKDDPDADPVASEYPPLPPSPTSIRSASHSHSHQADSSPPSTSTTQPYPPLPLSPPSLTAAADSGAPASGRPTVPSSHALRRPNPRFAFFRRKRDRAPASATAPPPPSDEKRDLEAQIDASDVEEEDEGEWEDRFEKGSLPFVRLENNRASCAICLMDFDEPRRKKSAKDRKMAAKGKKEEGKAGGNDDVEEIQTKDPEPEPEQETAAEPEPLRLLGCGHVFHKSCLDPWLTGVSGRCPTCQRKVEIPPSSSFKRKRTQAL